MSEPGGNEPNSQGYTYISQERFLLEELRYTLGQLQFQLEDFANSAAQQSRARDTAPILDAMLAYESRYQHLYREILDTAIPAHRDMEDMAARFDHERRRTVELLEGARIPWAETLLEAAQHHVTEDRRHVTEIAMSRIRTSDGTSDPESEPPSGV